MSKIIVLLNLWLLVYLVHMYIIKPPIQLVLGALYQGVIVAGA
jgi:hypothetical protein